MDLPSEDLSTVEDFLENEAFRRWVTDQRPEDQAVWQTWLALHPDKQSLYEEAVATFLVIQGKTAQISDEQVKAKTGQILDQLPDSPGMIRSLWPGRWGKWLAAAAVVGLLIWWRFDGIMLPVGRTDQPQASQETRQDSWKLVRNGTGQAMVVILPDNSSVLLSSGSQLRFRKTMNAGVREVFLEGEGFFEVTKNPARPFIVHAPNLTTKVLGTSFQVRSFDKESAAFVRVKTGKVAVSPVKSSEKPIVLTVNEELKLSANARPVVRRETFSTDEHAGAPLTQQFVFSYTPVPDILDQLEDSYHMAIQYDRNLLKSCTFTGQLNDMPFLEKVRLICLTIESTYELVDNQVIIHSQGCN
ncbi:FecR family protein [Larkinella sp. VNQ87]|uniref:FecR family protein n=1 Tax=Larkinella sp. VNQ87 TaxID=3400921 RepID=UPI003BFB15E0